MFSALSQWHTFNLGSSLRFVLMLKFVPYWAPSGPTLWSIVQTVLSTCNMFLRYLSVWIIVSKGVCCISVITTTTLACN